MRFLILLEQTESGFSIQVPELAVVTYGENIETAKQAAVEAIQINLEAYHESVKPIPESHPAEYHLKNPEFQDFVFAYEDVPQSSEWVAA